MRKIWAFISSMVMTLLVITSCFCFALKSEINNVASASAEQNFYTNDAYELISTNPSVNISNGIIENVAPFDTDTNTKMEGNSITPVADSYGQVKNKDFIINEYNPEIDDVIYLWVYLIDVISFDLKIALTDKVTSTIEWHFDSMKLQEFGTGWKLLGLNLSDISEVVNGQAKTYSYIRFNYCVDEDVDVEYDVEASDRFSFYHVFVDSKKDVEQSTGVVYNLNSSFYAFSDDFPFDDIIFIGDKVKVQTASEMFEYLYVGKYTLENYTNSGQYFWVMSIEDPNQAKAYLDFGDTVLFSKIGYYNFNIKLYKEELFENKIVLNRDVSVYCDEANLGRFSTGTKYQMKDNEKLLLTFKPSGNLILQDDFDISINNKNAEIDTYYEENGVLYVCVAGVSGGNSNLTISAQGSTKYNDNIQTFSATASLEIASTDQGVDIFIVIIWITFACFCVGIIIYLTISLVKARKNDVK